MEAAYIFLSNLGIFYYMLINSDLNVWIKILMNIVYIHKIEPTTACAFPALHINSSQWTDMYAPHIAHKEKRPLG